MVVDAMVLLVPWWFTQEVLIAGLIHSCEPPGSWSIDEQPRVTTLYLLKGCPWPSLRVRRVNDAQVNKLQVPCKPPRALTRFERR